MAGRCFAVNFSAQFGFPNIFSNARKCVVFLQLGCMVGCAFAVNRNYQVLRHKHFLTCKQICCFFPFGCMAWRGFAVTVDIRHDSLNFQVLSSMLENLLFAAAWLHGWALFCCICLCRSLIFEIF